MLDRVGQAAARGRRRCAWRILAAGPVLLAAASCAPVAPAADAAGEGAQDASGAAILATATPAADGASERHVGYYYPPITSRERYRSRARMLPGAGRERRIGFVTAITGRQFTFGYPPQYTMFAKGGRAQKLIIVALGERSLATIYQARALLAQLTAIARASDFFRDLGVETHFTFFDLARMLGFERITVSDGIGFTHRVEIE